MFDKNNINKDKNSYVSFGAGFGLLGGSLFVIIIGLVFGLIGDSIFPIVMALGPAFGMLFGIVIGAVMDYNKNKE